MVLMGFGSEGTGSVSDRLHWRYSVMVYVVLAIAHIGLKWLHYGQGLLKCNCPPQTTESFRSFAEAECSVSQYLRESRIAGVPILSLQREEPREVYLGYSSWVAAIFLLQAFLFCSTQPVWHFLSVRVSGINVKSLVSNLVMSQEGGHPQPKHEVISDAASSLKIFFDRTLRVRHESHWVPFIHGNMLTLSYITAKCLCLLNAVVQFYMIGALLQVNYPRYGFQSLSRWTSMPGNITTDIMQALFPGMDTDAIVHDVRNSVDPSAAKHLEELGIDKEMASNIEALFELQPESDITDIPQLSRSALRYHPILQRLEQKMISSATNKMMAEELTRRLWDEFNNNWTEYEPLLALPDQTNRYTEYPNEHHVSSHVGSDAKEGQPTTEAPQESIM